jgi:hypothetical protein
VGRGGRLARNALGSLIIRSWSLMSGSFSFSKSRVSCENDNQCCRVYFACKFLSELNKMIALCMDVN